MIPGSSGNLARTSHSTSKLFILKLYLIRCKTSRPGQEFIYRHSSLDIVAGSATRNYVSRNVPQYIIHAINTIVSDLMAPRRMYRAWHQTAVVAVSGYKLIKLFPG